jgi:hypothetical protein
MDLRPLLDKELSRPSRLGHLILLLASSTMTVVVASLWWTEPALPARTEAAFAVMTAIGFSWAAFAGWVLTTRRVLLGRDGLIAARMSVIFTTAFVAGALTLGLVNGGRAPYAAAVMGLGMLGVATALLVRARHRVVRLTARREALERDLGKDAG